MTLLIDRLAAEIAADPDGQYAGKTAKQIADIINNGWTSTEQVPVKKAVVDDWGDPVLDANGDPIVDKTYETKETRHDAAIFRVILHIADCPNTITAADVTAAKGA